MDKNGVIFDLDGTLWDSSAEVAESWTIVARRELGPSFTGFSATDMRGVMGLTMDEIAAKLFPFLPPAERMRVASSCMEYENRYLFSHPGKPYPHLWATLEVLRKEHPLAIVSNCQKGYIEAFLDGLRLRPYFIDRICWGDDLLLKGANIALIARRNSFARAIYLGDTEGDERAAREAGTLFIHAAYGFGRAVAPDASIHDLAELPEALKALWNR
jgi:phosphoglycolate phosphatase